MTTSPKTQSAPHIRQGTTSPLKTRMARSIHDSLKHLYPELELHEATEAAEAVIKELGLSAEYSIMYPAEIATGESVEGRHFVHDDQWDAPELTEQDLDEIGDILATRVVSKPWILQEKL